MRRIALTRSVSASKPLRRSFPTPTERFFGGLAHAFASTIGLPVSLISRDLEEAARSGLEDEIARNLKAGEGTASTNAIRDALRRRGESYARERKCRLIADRNPDAAIASASVKRAFGSRRAHAPLALESDTAGVCGVCGGCLLRAVSARAAGLTLPPLENAFDVYATEDIVDDWNGRKGRMTPGERAIAVRAVSALWRNSPACPTRPKESWPLVAKLG